MNREIQPGWLTGRKQISQYCGYSTRKVSREIAAGNIPFKRPNHKVLMVRVADLDNYLAGLASVPASRPIWAKEARK